MLIQRMRDGSEGVFAKIIIGLIVVVFALFGFGSITTFLAPVPQVASVNGEPVTQQAMELAVERNRRMLVARGQSAAAIDEDALRENVLQGLITRELLAQAADSFGLFYGDAALDQEIVTSEVFSIDGVFNADQFQNVIRGVGYTPLSYRDEMRTDKLFDQMISGIARTAYVTEVEATRFSQLFNQTRDVAFLSVSVDSMIDQVTISDEEINQYYTDNSQSFVTDETVDIAYVEISQAKLAADLPVSEEDLQQYFDENIGDYMTDEQRRVAHILIEVSDEVAEAEASARADEVYSRIKNGEDFSELAKALSDDFGSRATGGDLGFITTGVFLPEFEATAFDLDLNQVSAPVLTEQGFHLIKVIEIDPAIVPSLADVRTEVEQQYRLSATSEDFVLQSSNLAELLFEQPDSLELAASELGLEIQTTGHLSRDASHEFMNNSELVSAVFGVDVLIDGDNSDAIDLGDDRIVGLRVNEHFPSETLALELVQEDIRYILQREAAGTLAEERAQSVMDAIRGGSLAAFAANQYGLEWQVQNAASRFTPSLDPFLLQEAFKLPRPVENKESLGLTTTPAGDTVVLRVSAVNDIDASTVNAEEVKGIQASFSTQLGNFDFQDFQSSLTNVAEIERSN